MTSSLEKDLGWRGRHEVPFTESRQEMAKSSRSPEPVELLFTTTVGGWTLHARARAPAAYTTGHIASLLGTHGIDDERSRVLIRYGAMSSRAAVPFLLAYSVLTIHAASPAEWKQGKLVDLAVSMAPLPNGNPAPRKVYAYSVDGGEKFTRPKRWAGRLLT
jgi:hypothetical protein